MLKNNNKPLWLPARFFSSFLFGFYFFVGFGGPFIWVLIGGECGLVFWYAGVRVPCVRLCVRVFIAWLRHSDGWWFDADFLGCTVV
jgi:hypothetical protein